MNKPEPRFAFGKNWQRFLRCVNEERIAAAEKSLQSMLEVDSLAGMSFLDIGSGSGLFSLAAMRLGAARVHSFDYDPQSVACALELKRRFFSDASSWSVEQGSVLDPSYLTRLGRFNVVYSWGVLHHTGNMWKALENVAALVEPQGKLFVALYNAQGLRSRLWRAVKRCYVSGAIWRPPIVAIYGGYCVATGLIVDLFLHPRNPLTRYRRPESTRGMSPWPDMVDWLGGYPFEVATPGAVFDLFKKKGFELVQLQVEGRGHGNNEFVFKKR
jgi:2-polyprenyl-6-hydroxyphenyl methylase/3-demethylubiquinone-9 3-methyltransferase